MYPTLFQRSRILWSLLTAGLAPSLAGADPAALAAEKPVPPPAAVAPSFIRFSEDEHGAKLETAVAKYQNAAGETVDLIGAVHLGDPGYYKGLNEAFKGYEVVLFELVGDPAGVQKPEAAGNAPKADAAASILRGAQLMLTNMLQLQHQVEGIDYTAPNFVHADLNWEQFRALQKQKGESFATLLRESMKAQAALAKEKKAAGKPPADEGGLGSILALVGALQGSDTSGLKLLMARQFKDAEEMMAKMEGPDGTVIIAERNKAALKVMDEQLGAGRKRLGIFYGAGHFADMEKRLVERGFQRKETQWRTAWDIPKAVKKEAA